MSSLFTKIGLWALNFSSNETVKLIISRLIPILMTYIKDLIPFIIDEIKKVAENPDLKGTDKFDAVIAAVVSTFPGVQRSIINMFVELLYNLLIKPEEKPTV